MTDRPRPECDGASLEPAGPRSDVLRAYRLADLFPDIQPELLGFLARRTGDPEAAADLAQDLFLKAAGVSTAFPDREQARAYVFRMAINLAIDRTRTATRRSELLTGTEILFEDTADDPEAAAVTRDQMRHIERALSELPEKCREVLILSRMYGLSYKEIAQRLNVSISFVEKYQLRALRHCRDRLGRDFAG